MAPRDRISMLPVVDGATTFDQEVPINTVILNEDDGGRFQLLATAAEDDNLFTASIRALGESIPPVAPPSIDTAFTCGGTLGAVRKTTVDSFDMANLAAASPHANLATERENSACSVGDTDLFVGTGSQSGGMNRLSTIEKVDTTAETTVATHGDTTVAYTNMRGGQSSTECIYAGGFSDPALSVQLDVMESFLKSANVTATGFGVLTAPKIGGVSFSSGTDCYFGAGRTTANAYVVNVDIVDHATDSDASPHGDLTEAHYIGAGCESTIDGFAMCGFVAGGGASNVIEIMNLANNVLATDHGDATIAGTFCSAGSSGPVDGFLMGFIQNGSLTNRFSYAALVTATTWSTLSDSRYLASGGQG